MRAQFIRGEDPKKSMDIGSSYLEKQKIRSINWGVDSDWLEEVLQREYYFELYKNIPLLFAYSKDLDKWMALTPKEIEGTLRSGWQSSKQFALRDIVNQIDKKFPDIKESFNFERGLEPKRSMGIGKIKLDKQIIEKIDWDINPLDDKFYEFLEISEFIPDWKGIPILVVHVKDKQTGETGYYAVSDTGAGKTNFTVYGPQRALKNIKNNLRNNGKIKESVNFERGKDPMDAMELGDVRGRNLNNITNILIDHFENLFPKGQTIGESRQEVNIGMGNREDIETDRIIIYTQYGGYVFNLSWTGNPINTKVTQRFEAKWQKMPRGPEDGGTYLVLNGALAQISQWIKQI